MKKLLFIIGLIATVLLAYYCVSGHGLQIEQDIKTRLVQKFNTENISKNVIAKVSGRDVILTGDVAEDEMKVAAYKAAVNLYGVRDVGDKIQVAEAPLLMRYEPAPAVSTLEVSDEPFFDLDIESSFEEDKMAEASETQPEIQPEIEMAPPKGMSFDAQVESVPEEVGVVEVVNELEMVEEVEPVQPEPEAIAEVIEPAKIVDECQGEFAALLEKEKINFALGSATIQSSSYKLLNRIANAAKECKDSVITIHGYTDSSGDVNANIKLSLARTKSVGKYLIGKGVRQEIRVIGNGPKDPIATNDTDEGRAKNRRIEFKVLKIKN